MANPAAGDPAYYTDKDIEICDKSTAGSSAIAPGIVTHQALTGGNWAACSSGDYGRFGVVPNMDPYNVDADPEFSNATGGEWYVTFSNTNTTKGGMYVVADNSGKVKGLVEATITATPTQADVQAALRAVFSIIGTYRGKDETEGQGLDKKASDITNAVGRIRLRGY